MNKGWVCGLIALATLGGHPGAQWATPRTSVVFPDQSVVRVAVADTPATRQRGLMFRETLGQNEGMLFLFEQPGSYPFWMQNCLISLDIIWLDVHMQVVSIAHSVPPCRLANCSPPCSSNECPTYPHQGQALYVVEVASGFAKEHGVKVGDRVLLRHVARSGRER
jgi:uncharacterized membrane protein (UPF0127 family)